MLPGFCTCPVDLLTSFKGVARVLGTTINERPDLRLTACHALRIIINKSCSTGRVIIVTERQVMEPLQCPNVTLCPFCRLRTRKGRVGSLLQELPAHFLQRVQSAAPSWGV